MPQKRVDAVCQVDRNLELTSAMHCQVILVIIDSARIVVIEWQCCQIVQLKDS